MKKLFIILSLAAVSLSSCLKDTPNTDFSSIGPVLELPYAGLQYFSSDAVLAAGDTIKISFGVNMASAKPLTTATNYTIAVDNSLLTAYNTANTAIAYLPMPAGSYVFSKTSGTIAAGARLDSITVTIYKNKLDPSQSYMFPVKLASTSNGILSGNFNAHYYHFIGNDFAGNYTWDYRRYNNGTGPGNNPDGTPAIPSLGQGGPTSAGTTLGQAGKILPVSPTEFQMLTGYNSSGVYYDVKFTRTVTNGVVTYSNWTVGIDPVSEANWTGAGISLKTAPVFTIPPPTKASDPIIFEINYVAGAASGRYIDDTYHK
ncbi:MAG: hypothetical protein JWR12_1725 [Mucilaginibacter sp.]|jgi:hypothetical protein|nr:hypothetical protein [Mucilaginibacter sp.]